MYWEYQRQLRDDSDMYNPEVTSKMFKKHEAYYQIYGDYAILFFDLRAARYVVYGY